MVFGGRYSFGAESGELIHVGEFGQTKGDVSHWHNLYVWRQFDELSAQRPTSAARPRTSERPATRRHDASAQPH